MVFGRSSGIGKDVLRNFMSVGVHGNQWLEGLTMLGLFDKVATLLRLIGWSPKEPRALQRVRTAI